MMSSTGTSMDGLNELLAERNRYETWLEELEARRPSAPPHVIERVKADYTGRLTHVTDQLRGRAADLESTVTALQSRLAGLATQEASRRDERAETELRAAVGEYARDHADATIRACDDAIAGIQAERGALALELARMQDVLAKVLKRDEPAPVVAPIPVEPVQPEPEPELEPEPEIVFAAVEPVSSVLEISTAEPREAESVADTAPVLDAVAETVLEPITALAPEVPAKPSSVESSLAAKELEFLHSVVRPSGQSNDLLPPPVLNAPRRSATPMSSGAVGGMRDALREAQENAGTGTMPAFLRDMPTEQVKTLKCQECATMNYPTEWYCERCGGELAAM